jgi:dipeptidyl aminopeptidase/acylaminoacyl peptidase
MDSISFRVVGAPPVADDSTPLDPAPVWSPDRTRLALVLTHGDVASNQQVSDILIYDVRAESFSRVRQISLSSNDNISPVAGLQWVSPSKLAFIALNGERIRQVWELETRTGELTKITASSTSIQSFAMVGESVIYLARPERRQLMTAAARRDGYVVTDESLTELLTDGAAGPVIGHQPQLFVQRGSAPPRHLMPDSGDIFSSFAPTLSPDGRYALIAVARAPGDMPSTWGPVAQTRPQSALYTYRLINFQSGEVQPLINVPLAGLPVGNPIWSAASNAVIIAGVASPNGHDVRNERWMLKIRVPDRSVTALGRTESCPLGFGKDGLVLIGIPRPSPFGMRCDSAPERTAPSSSGLTWASQSFPKIVVEQSLDEPPRYMILDRPSSKRLLLDPNPQLRELRLSKGTEMSWRAGDRNVRGALYLPAGRGRLLPLVIQIRSYDPDVFSLDGGYASNGAAQALAANGFAVVQVGLASVGGREENSTNLELIEAIVDSLAKQGRIDPKRVGLWAFSRSGMAVRHAIAFSRYRFAAAVLADSLEAGYVTYATSSGTWGKKFIPASIDPIFGGPPAGQSLAYWVKDAATFNFDRWHTPVRELRFGPGQSLEEGWETLNMLRRLSKPVELVWLPDAAHGIVRPSDRMAVQGGSVDWFRFWLQGRTDDDPAKTDQYRRWSRLRMLSQRDLGSAPAPHSADQRFKCVTYCATNPRVCDDAGHLSASRHWFVRSK